ncbi:MAG: nucleotide-binding protein [Bacteroidia bacterium]|nr:nucleotide-binding protein [Bacteroidia bacterium]
MSETKLPVVFVSSSREGLTVARRIQQLLEDDAEIIVWDQDAFEPTVDSLESLISQANASDFAIFVFTPDDDAVQRGERVIKARDNVVFEAGLFMGILGRKRVFFVKPTAPRTLALPTDFLGLSYITYIPREPQTVASLGGAATRIRDRISKAGLRDKFRSSMFEADPAEIQVHEVVYTIKLLNEAGDAELRQDIEISARSRPVPYKRHTVFSHTSSMAWNEMNLKAADDAGKPLHIEKLQDDANRKEFNVRFPVALRRGSRLRYHYACRWNSMFPPESSYMIFKSNSEVFRFVLILPAHFELRFVEASAIWADDSSSQIPVNAATPSAPDAEGFGRHEFDFDEELFSNRDIKIQWAWESRPGT